MTNETQTNTEAVENVETVENTTENTEGHAEKTEQNFCEKNSETFSRIFFTLLFGLIGWVAICIFTFVVLIQFGFLLITGKVNKNLKAFNKEIGLYMVDMIKYLSFQTDEKPFPFRDWPYDDEKKSSDTEQNSTEAVQATK